MDHLWSPWRYRYVSLGGPKDVCLFCEKAAASNDRENYIVLRAEHNFVLLNLYPYTSGHVMVVPYAHVADLAAADGDTLINAHTSGVSYFGLAKLGLQPLREVQCNLGWRRRDGTTHPRVC